MLRSRRSRPLSRLASRSSTRRARTGGARPTSATTSGSSLAPFAHAERRASARVVTKGGMARPERRLGARRPGKGDPRRLRGEPRGARRACRSTSISSMRPIRARPGGRPACAHPARRRRASSGMSGVANVNRSQLDEALVHAPIAAVQVGLSAFDDSALRGGVVERCVEAGVAVIAHSPLGGPRRKRALARNHGLADVASALGATPAEVALAWLLDVSPALVAIPGARTSEAARSAARAARLVLRDEDRAACRRFRRSHSASAAAISRHSPGRGRARDGHPRCRQDPCRVGVRRPRLRPPQSGQAGRVASRPRRSAR